MADDHPRLLYLPVPQALVRVWIRDLLVLSRYSEYHAFRHALFATDVQHQSRTVDDGGHLSDN
ncbi:MAG: hypothetical protein CME15_10950 [Gemmatimonadetes bacterium]|nr:hypothetical protein [Gemmatimonadota bacterium]